jgi:hypothetical protein
MALLRLCVECKQCFPETQFHRHNKTVFTGQCVACYNKNATLYWAASRPKRERQASRQHETKLKKYGLTAPQYDALLQQQKGVCMCCKQPETRVPFYRWGRCAIDKPQRLSVDHCHKTGVVRGLLCDKCNRLTGALEYYMDRVMPVLQYLQRKGAQN